MPGWYYENRSRALASMKARRLKNPDRYAFRLILSNAQIRNIPVSCSKDQFCKWFNNTLKVCHYCELPEEVSLLFLKKRLTIDRKDNTFGYIIDNLVFACDVCNRSKGSFFSYVEWKEIANKYVKPKIKLFLEGNTGD